MGNFTQALQAGRDAGKSFTDVIKDSVPPALVASIAAVGTVLGTVLVGGLIAAAAAMATFIGVSPLLVRWDWWELPLVLLLCIGTS